MKTCHFPFIASILLASACGSEQIDLYDLDGGTGGGTTIPGLIELDLTPAMSSIE